MAAFHMAPCTCSVFGHSKQTLDLRMSSVISNCSVHQWEYKKSKQDFLRKVFWYKDGGAVCWQVTQENTEAEEIQAVVSQEEQSASQQGAKTAALKGMHVYIFRFISYSLGHVNCTLDP